MDDDWSETEIVRGLQQGKSNAWAALCHQYSERLWRYVARLIGSNEAAVADIFQETLLAVAGSGRNLSDDTRIWAWLSTIGHNQCALFWRRRSRDAVSLQHDPLTEQPEDLLLQQETIEIVRLLLAELPAHYATVLTAKYAAGHSVDQIAQQLGESAETVRSRLARARTDFRQRYEARTRSDYQNENSSIPTTH